MVLNSSTLTCLMPEVNLPSDFEVDDTDSVSAGGDATSLNGGLDNRDHADIYVGLVFDGFLDYDNLTAAMPQITIQFFRPPMIDIARDLIIYQPQTFNDIGISVRLSKGKIHNSRKGVFMGYLE